MRNAIGMKRPTKQCQKCGRVQWVYRSGRRFWKCGYCNHRSDRYKAKQRRMEKNAWKQVWKTV